MVGLANSITGTASGWVAPAEIPLLRAAGGTSATQMLYRFAHAGIGAQLHADVARLTGSPAARCARRIDVVLHREDRGGRQHRPLRPVPARLRDPRDRDVGADRRERRRRRGRLRLPADRDPEEHRLHAPAGRRRLRRSGRTSSPGRLPGRRRGRQPARNSAPATERQRLRCRRARCSRSGSTLWCPPGSAPSLRSRPCCRQSEQGGSAPFRRSRPDAPRKVGAATPPTGCSAACHSRARSRSGSPRPSHDPHARSSHSRPSSSAQPRSPSPSG